MNTQLSQNLLSLIAPIALTGTACLALFTPIALRKNNIAPGLITLVAALILFFLMPLIHCTSGEIFSGALIITPGTTLLTYIFLACLALTTAISLDSRANAKGGGEYYALLSLAAAALIFLTMAGELVTVFISIELLSVCLYSLAAANRSALGAEAGYKYFLLGSLGTALLVMGIALIYGTLGSLNFTELALLLKTKQPPQALTLAGFLFLISGFAFKTALAPFHMWAPDVYEGSPTPVAAFMSAAVKTGAVIILYRIFSLTSPALHFAGVFWLLAIISMVTGNLSALPQQNLKRMLAYSSIAHAGYLTTGFFGAPDSMAGIYYYLVVYASANIGAFAVMATLEQNERGITVKDLAGLATRQPMLATAMAIFMLSLAGVPPLSGFFAKFFVFTAALKTGNLWLVISALLMSVIAAYYYLRVIVAMFMEHEHAVLKPLASKTLTAAILLLASATVLLGIFADPLLKVCKAAAL